MAADDEIGKVRMPGDGERAARLAKLAAEDAEMAAYTQLLRDLYEKVCSLEAAARVERVGRCGTRVVSKEQDYGAPQALSTEQALATVNEMRNGERAHFLTKLALSNPVSLDKIK